MKNVLFVCIHNSEAEVWRDYHELAPPRDVEAWRKTGEVAPGTARKYGEVSRHFLRFLGDGARRDMATITSREIAAFRDDTAARLAVGTVNGALKIVRIVFGDATKAKLVSGNEAA